MREMKSPGEIIFQSLEEQYRKAGLPTDLIRPGLEFTVFNLADLARPMPFSLPACRLNFFVFGFIKKAMGRYTIDHEEFSLRERTVYFTNPGHFRSFSYQQISEAYLITFSENFLNEFIPVDAFTEFPFLLTEMLPARTATPEVFSEFEQLYLQILQEYNSHSLYRKKVIGSLFYALLLKFKEHFWMDYNSIYEGNRGSAIVKRFKKDLERHYRELADEIVPNVFSIPDYASLQHLHPNYFSQVIRSKTGKTVGAWINEKSISEAKSLLKNTPYPIKEITYRLGFSDTGNFSTHFKKHVGMSPKAYRKEP